MPIERRYERLFGDELHRLIQERPVAWLPLGILERHGEHLPWGLDGLKAHAVCAWLAEELGGVVLPACHLAGVHGDCREGDAAEFRRRHAAVGDLLYREETLRIWLHETLEGLANLGFRVIVAYTGHYPEVQTQIVREVAERFTASGRSAPGGTATVIPFWEPLACGGGDHGGKWETSIALAVIPDQVRLEAVRDEPTGRAGWYRGQEVRGEASAEFGRQALARIREYLAAAVEQAFV